MGCLPKPAGIIFMSSQTIGTLIWVSIRPMLRLTLCTSAGFVITKAGLMPPIAARRVFSKSRLMSSDVSKEEQNVFLPALFFSKIVSAFTPENIGNLGPVVIVCLLYQFTGLVACFIILLFFWVPHRFRWGFIVAGVWGNYGDLPTAVIMSVTASPPFNGTKDQDLAVAYISAFVLVFIITLFPLGGHHLVAKDFQGPEKDDEDIRRSVMEKSKENAVIFVGLLHSSISYARRCIRSSATLEDDTENPTLPPQMNSPSREGRSTQSEVEKQDRSQSVGPPAPLPSIDRVVPMQAKLSRTESTVVSIETDIPTTTIALAAAMPQDELNLPHTETVFPLERLRAKFSQFLSRFYTFRNNTRGFFRSLLTVPTVSVVAAIIISVIQPVKKLFVSLPSSPKAPDGQPPLAFIMDTAAFLGGASIPLNLICLGSALARMELPRSQWKKKPIGATLALAVWRMVIQPIIGVLLIGVLTQAGLISTENKVLRFVCIFFSCVPTATTQVFLTQVYSGTGSAEHLSAFLIPQYVLMFISSTTVTAYALHILFK